MHRHHHPLHHHQHGNNKVCVASPSTSHHPRVAFAFVLGRVGGGRIHVFNKGPAANRLEVEGNVAVVVVVVDVVVLDVWLLLLQVRMIIMRTAS
jgi:hypothetical protein